MSWRRELSRLGAPFHRPKLADDLKAEIRSHLEMEERENLESRMPPTKLTTPRCDDSATRPWPKKRAGRCGPGIRFR
jgi:hypothetical protein